MSNDLFARPSALAPGNIRKCLWDGQQGTVNRIQFPAKLLGDL
jgi:hypothetical protein